MSDPESIVEWLSENQLSTIYSSAYWNNIENERKKPFWIEDGNFESCKEYLIKSGLRDQFRVALEKAELEGSNNLVVADLASGIGWASAGMSKRSEIELVYSVEISRHRLQMGLKACDMEGGDRRKIKRCLGSFYDLKLPDSCLDRVFMIQAFHHADRPLHLLVEIDRVLKPGGKVVLAGEHSIGMLRVIKKVGQKLLVGAGLNISSQDLWPPDQILGDHYYLPGDYKLFFHGLGYDSNVTSMGGRGEVLIYTGNKPP
jgi:SAM-dependent methyltransferase